MEKNQLRGVGEGKLNWEGEVLLKLRDLKLLPADLLDLKVQDLKALDRKVRDRKVQDRKAPDLKVLQKVLKPLIVANLNILALTAQLKALELIVLKAQDLLRRNLRAEAAKHLEEKELPAIPAVPKILQATVLNLLPVVNPLPNLKEVMVQLSREVLLARALQVEVLLNLERIRLMMLLRLWEELEICLMVLVMVLVLIWKVLDRFFLVYWGFFRCLTSGGWSERDRGGGYYRWELVHWKF